MRRQSHSSTAGRGEAATSSGMEFWLPGWESCSKAHPASLCVCGRAGNQPIFHDRRLDVLKLVVKFLLAARLVLQSRMVFFFKMFLPLAGTSSDLHRLNAESPYWEIPGDSPNISLGVQKPSRWQFRSTKVFALMLCWTSNQWVKQIHFWTCNCLWKMVL